MVESLQAGGWDVCLGLTPTAASWVQESLSGLATLTGHPVRSRYERPGEVDAWPGADAILFAPATFNSLNSWALGLTSSYVTGVAAEAIGRRIPVLAMPRERRPRAAPPVRAVHRGAALRRRDGAPRRRRRAPRTSAASGPQGYPWRLALDAVEAAVRP